MSDLVGNDCVVINEQGERVQANITSDRWPLQPGIGPDFQGALQGHPGDDGWAFWNAETGGMRLRVEHPDYLPQDIITTAPQQIRVTLKRAPLQRIHVDGLVYRRADGSEWHGYSTDGFRDYQRFLDGENIRPLLEQARKLGSNMRRTFGMWGYGFVTPDNYGPFRPHKYPDYYARIPEFCALLAEYGLYVEFTVFADTSDVMPNQAEQIAHFNAVCASLRLSDNTFVELVNENDQHGNHVDTYAFTKPSGMPACSGSNGEGRNPTQPFWDYSNLHAEGIRLPLSTSTVWYAINGYKDEKDPEKDWPGTHQVTNNDEPRKTQDPFIAWQMGTGSRYGGWMNFHTPSGTQSLLLNDTEAACTKQAFRGAQGKDYQP